SNSSCICAVASCGQYNLGSSSSSATTATTTRTHHWNIGSHNSHGDGLSIHLNSIKFPLCRDSIGPASIGNFCLALGASRAIIEHSHILHWTNLLKESLMQRVSYQKRERERGANLKVLFGD